MDQKKIVELLSFWVVNSLVLLVSSAIFGGSVVLGNDKVSAPMAAVLAGLIITAASYLVPPIVARSGFKVKSDPIRGVILAGANFVIVWIIKRLAQLTGLGVANIFYVVVLAALLTLGQWAVAKATGGMVKK